MREIKKQGNGFVNRDGLFFKCAYDKDIICNTECVALEINQIVLTKTATCLRDGFTFGEIVEHFPGE